MCLTGIHGQIYMAWTRKKKDTEKLLKKQILEAELEGVCSYSLEVVYTVSAQSSACS